MIAQIPTTRQAQLNARTHESHLSRSQFEKNTQVRQNARFRFESAQLETDYRTIILARQIEFAEAESLLEHICEDVRQMTEICFPADSVARLQLK